MKYTIVIAALFGLASAVQDDTTKVWELRSVNDHKTDSDLQKTFGDHATKSADARPPMRSHIMTQKKAAPAASSSDSSSSSSDSEADKKNVQVNDDDVDHSGEFFKPTEHDKLGDGGYKRVTTPRFSADSDDIFMRSMIENYSLEGKNKDGSPNGNFLIDEAAARAAAAEVLTTHKKMTGKTLDTYLKTYFPRTWAHFDVNRTGKVEAIKMPQFMRFLASDQQMYLW
jgi:hypothetical protein